MAYVKNTGGIIVGGGTEAGAVGSATGATASQSSNDVSQAINFLQNPSLAGALALYGEDVFPFRNELDQFASYAPIFTFGCLTDLEYNFPLSYRTIGPLVKVIKSGGGGGPTIPSLYDLDGKREFYIEDVKITNTVAPNPDSRHTNLHNITFKVIEPYSMGQFFHNLRTASLVTGHRNYQDCPYVLSVAFIGYDDEGNVQSPFFSQRHFPIQLIQVEMDVTESGAVYTVTAAPYSDMAVQDRAQRLKTDITITGESVAEILQNGARSLTVEMNKLSEGQESNEQVVQGDRYIIQFPNTSILGALGGIGDILGALGPTVRAAGSTLQDLFESLVGEQDLSPQAAARVVENNSAFTTGTFTGDIYLNQARVDINQIGRSSLLRPGVTYTENQTPYQIPGFSETEPGSGLFRRGALQYDFSTQNYSFEKGTRITEVIEEVILTSQYARDFSTANGDFTGRIPWFRIEPQTYNAGGFLGGLIRGENPKIYVYRVVPYNIDESTISAPDTGSLNFIKKAAKQLLAAKAYSYIYTGTNTDIIDFDLKFNMAFYTGVEAARSQRNLGQVLGGAASFVARELESVFTTGLNTVLGVGTDGDSPIRDEDDPLTGNARGASGGNASDDPETGTARYFNDMVINTGDDMIQVDLKIHGDPYFIADVSLGNYIGLPTVPFSPVTIDGSMNPIDGEVHIILNFRTPVDYNEEDGFVEYPLGGFLPIAMFSGLYQVIKVENDFKDGKFVQTLRLARKRNQDLTLEAVAGALINAAGGLLGSGNAVQVGAPIHQIDPPGPDQAIV